MLQSLHDRTNSWVVWAIVAGLSFLFALFGMSYYLTPSGSEAAIKASVNGEPIALRIYQQNLENHVNALGLTQASDDVKNEVMQQLIQKALLVQIAKENGFVVSNAQIDESIVNMPLFTDEGKFSQERFDLIIRQLGLSTSDLKRDMGADILVTELEQGVFSTQILLTHTLESYIQMVLQKRDINYAFLPFSAFDSDVVSEERLKEYYHQHSSELLSLDQIEVDYVILDQADLAKDSALSQEQVQKLFHEQGEQMAELAFESPDSLQPIIQALHLPLLTSEKLVQDATSNSDLFKDPSILSIVFSESVLNGDNSGLIPLSDTQVMVLRQKTFYPSHPLSFEEAQNKIEAELKLVVQKEQAERFLESLLQKAALGQKESILRELDQKHVSWQSKTAVSKADSDLPRMVKQAVWAMPEDAVGEWSHAADAQGLFLIQLLQVSFPTEQQIKKDRAHFNVGLKALQTQLFLFNLLKQKQRHADIQIYH